VTQTQRGNHQRSFATDNSQTITLSGGQVTHVKHAEQSEILRRNFYEVRQGVWTLVGNGLSNQTFVEGPEGIIAIDTGESTEEMREAIAELRQVTDRPIVAVLYTHFHYVGGTEAVFEDAATHGISRESIPIYSHEKVIHNRSRTATEIATAYGRGLVEQFALMLPENGPDGRVNVGLGHFYRNPNHAPFTSVFVPPTRTFADSTTLEVAGLAIEVTHAPSDADDSVTFWFPALGVAVHNLVWPVLFNIFAIRGEEYRDPQVLIRGVDHLLSLKAEHLVAAHGPPMSGSTEIADRVTKYRDAIQFIWDQSVRFINKGFTAADVGHLVNLPPECDDDFITAERYGVTEHHARQIRNGLFGWFDGDESQLFPLPSDERSRRMIDGFGGREKVRSLARVALSADDVRWATELSTWLVRSAGMDEVADQVDRQLLADCLRTIGQRTTAANIRVWCLTRALSLEEKVDTSRLYQHRFNRKQILSSPIESSVHVLRVLVDSDRAHGLNTHIAFDFGDRGTNGLHIRNSVACATTGSGAAHTVTCSLETWAELLTGKLKLSSAIDDGQVVVTGDVAAVKTALAIFEVEGLRS
jgi:alkyl sulfatase BDS1-like metallo-beta-lactamase superfamily hydrolase